MVHRASRGGPSVALEEGGELLELEVQDGLEEAHLDLAPSPGLAPAQKRREDALDQVGPGEEVGDGHAHRDRRLARVSV